MAAIRLPAWLNAGSVSYPAENDRLSEAASLAPGGASPAARSGVFPADGNSLSVAQHGTPNMSVDVSPGQCAVQGTITTTQGVYICTSDSTVNLAIAAANATNPRIDVVVVTVEDAQYAGASNDALLQVITGVPAATPAVPAAPANSLVIAQIAVAAGATSIVAANITDVRVWTAARGGIVPCLSTALPAAPYSGMTVWCTDTKQIKTYDGSAWFTAADEGNWQAVTAASGFVSSASVRKVGGMIQFRGSFSPSSGNFATSASITVAAASGTPVAPASARNAVAAHTFGGGSVPSVCRLIINADGSIVILNIEQTSVTTVWLDGIQVSA